MDERRKVVKYAVLSRVLVIGLSSVSNFLIPDHVPDSFQIPLGPRVPTKYDKAVNFIFGGLKRWDAQYFAHIATYGYTYESTLAFFPGFPLILQGLSKPLYYTVKPHLSYQNCLLVTGVALNFILFILAALSLYALVSRVSKWSPLNAALFFCISPASIFFTAPYTETLYSFLVFTGLYFWIQNQILISSVFFMFGTLIRSNGITNSIFILSNFIFLIQLKKSFLSLILGLIETVPCIIVIVSPYFGFQAYSYNLFCVSKPPNKVFPMHLVNYAKIQGLKMASSQIEWCNSTLPNSYSYVQKNYWNVGPFKYYEFKQIPNFLLAAPIIIIVLHYFLRSTRSVQSRTLWYLTLHATFLTIFGLIFANVQVTTRLIASSSPILYIAASQNFLPFSFKKPRKFPFFPFNLSPLKKYKFIARFTIWFFITYFVVGTIAFSNNFPWT